jgi:hypothetical protein
MELDTMTMLVEGKLITCIFINFLSPSTQPSKMLTKGGQTMFIGLLSTRDMSVLTRSHYRVSVTPILEHNSSLPVTALVGLGFLCGVPRSHSDTPHLVGLLWISDRPLEDISTRQHTTLTTDRHQMIRTRNPSKRGAPDLRLRPRGHRDRPSTQLFNLNAEGWKSIQQHRANSSSANR